MATPITDVHRAQVKAVYDTVKAAGETWQALDQLMDIVTQKVSVNNPFIENEDWDLIVPVYLPLFDSKRDAHVVKSAAIPNFIPNP